MIQKDKGPFSINYREQGPHARGVYPTQYTSRKRTARAKQEEQADARIMRSNKKSGRKEHGHEGEKSQTRPN